jgi:hypothetical protein
MASLLVVVLLGVGCGSATRKDAPRRLPPPSTADVREIASAMPTLDVYCSYVGINGESPQLVAYVDRLVAMRRSSDPDAPIVVQEGAGSTTLREVIASVVHTLDETNAFGKPTCAPSLGRRLSQAAGIAPLR